MAKGYFLRIGKYKNSDGKAYDYKRGGKNTRVVKVVDHDVIKKNIFSIADKDASVYYNAGLFCYEGQKPKIMPKEEVKKEETKKEVKK